MARGGARPNAGRKRKVDEESLIQQLRPYSEGIVAKLAEGAQNGNETLIRLFMEYFYGKPLQRVENSGDQTITIISATE